MIKVDSLPQIQIPNPSEWLRKLGVLTLAASGATIPMEAIEILPNVSLTRVAGLLITALCISVLWMEKQTPRPTTVAVAGVAFSFWMSLTSLWGAHPERGFLMAVVYLSVTLFVVTGTVLVRTFEDVRMILLGFILGAIVAAVMLFIQLPTMLSGDTEAITLTSFGQNTNFLAMTLMVGANFCFYLFHQDQKKWSRLSFTLPLTAVAFMSGVLLTGSRAGLLAMTLTTVPYALFLVLRGKINLGTMLAFAALATAFFVAAPETTTARFTAEAFERTGGVRAEKTVQSLTAFSDSPIVGVGLSTVQLKYTGELGNLGHRTHNSVIEVLATGGLIGLTLFLLFVGGAIWAALRAESKYRMLGLISPSGLLIFSGAHSIEASKVLWYIMVPFVVFAPFASFRPGQIGLQPQRPLS